MKLKNSRIRTKLKEGKVVYGTCICSHSPDIVHLAGLCGLDFCRIDTEHSWRQDSCLDNMIRASMLAGIEAIVRIDRGNPFLIRKALEVGAAGIIVPHVVNEKEVNEIVKASKFPPSGNRGFSNLNISGGYGIYDSQDWIMWSNDELLIGVMIENDQAVKNIDAILQIEEVDFVLFGPSDYSLSIGMDKPDTENKLVHTAIMKTVESAKKYKKGIMIGVGYPWDKNIKKYLDIGFDMIEIGHDYSILRDIWKNILQEIHLNEP